MLVNMVKKSKAGRAGLEAVKQVAVDEEKLISSEVDGKKVSYLSCPSNFGFEPILTDP